MPKDKSRDRIPASKRRASRIQAARDQRSKLGVKADKSGAPRFVVDWNAVYELFRIQCTIEEVCGVLGCTYDTLATACLRELNLPISELKEQKSAGGKASLRRTQFQVAETQRNPVMLIWLGKNYLKQADKTEVTVADPGEVARAIKTALDEIETATAPKGPGAKG